MAVFPRFISLPNSYRGPQGCRSDFGHTIFSFFGSHIGAGQPVQTRSPAPSKFFGT